jgi:predicted phosphoribosyltransferase
MIFKDRSEAGKLLARKLMKFKDSKDAIVLGIPRGGVAVAYEIAKILELPLDIVVIKKIGHPQNEELAIGAAGIDSHYINSAIAFDIPQKYIDKAIKQKQREAQDKYNMLKGKELAHELKGKTVILIDDGIATGSTIVLALQVIKKKSPKEVIVAVPVAPFGIKETFRDLSSQFVCIEIPSYFNAISQFYIDFMPVEDGEVKEMLEEAKNNIF